MHSSLQGAGVTCVCRVQSLGQALASFPSPSHTAEDGGHVDWEGADFAISDICDTLRVMRAEASLLKCAALPRLMPLRLSVQAPHSYHRALHLIPCQRMRNAHARHWQSWQSTLPLSHALVL